MQERGEPYIQVRAINGSPVKTGEVELIIYRHDVLAPKVMKVMGINSINAIPKGLDSTNKPCYNDADACAMMAMQNVYTRMNGLNL